MTFSIQGSPLRVGDCVIVHFDVTGVYHLKADDNTTFLCPSTGWEYYAIEVVAAGETVPSRASSFDRPTNDADDDNFGDAGLDRAGSSPSPQRTHIIANDNDTALVNNGPMREWLQQPPNAVPHAPTPSQAPLSQVPPRSSW